MTKRSREDCEPSLGSDTTEEAFNSNTETHPLNTSTTTTSSKYIQLDLESIVAPTPVMRCSLPPHRQTLVFTSYEDYDVHYAKLHTNRCLECRKNFPTEHFLSLHIEENHDALFSVKKERGDKMYACFVEDCERRCSTPQKRRMHLIDKHLFPKDYDFYIVIHGIGGRSSMLQSWKHRRRSSATLNIPRNQEATERQNSIKESSAEGIEIKSSITGDIPASSSTKEDTDMEGLSEAMSALRFVPSSIRFGGRGRGSGRSGLSRNR